MSNYPDNFNSAAFKARWGSDDDDDTITMNQVNTFTKRLSNEIRDLVAERVAKAFPGFAMDHKAFDAGVVEDCITDAIVEIIEEARE